MKYSIVDIEFIVAMAGDVTNPISEGVGNHLSEGVGEVYFIGDETRVKIGASGNLRQRLRSLQRLSASKLQLLHYERGGFYKERVYHKFFANYLIGKEWFRREGNLVRFLDNVINSSGNALAIIDRPIIDSQELERIHQEYLRELERIDQEYLRELEEIRQWGERLREMRRHPERFEISRRCIPMERGQIIVVDGSGVCWLRRYPWRFRRGVPAGRE